MSKKLRKIFLDINKQNQNKACVHQQLFQKFKIKFKIQNKKYQH